MKLTAPDYYKEFHCIADKCRHNCCIGWEIDIDEDTLGFYEEIDGEFGRRLNENIDFCNECFKLNEDERCPFLNGENLCDIMLELGEEGLCQICADHPRYRNYFSDRTEIGLGLCCEAAGGLILGNRGKVCETVLEDDGGEEVLTENEHEILAVRKSLIDIVQNRDKSVEDRTKELMQFFGARMPEKSIPEWADILGSLERLDSAWDIELDRLRNFRGVIQNNRFEIEFEQLLVYFLYRHLAGAENEADLAARTAFAVLGYRIICALCAMNENCTLDDVVEYARLYSSEIEYSDENTDFLIELLRKEVIYVSRDEKE